MPKSKQKFEKIAFMASDMPEAVEARDRLVARYGIVETGDADAIVALGGDGHMLQTLHRFMNDSIPIYGMNRGSVGFLMNEYSEDDLLQRLAEAEVSRIHPLAMLAYVALERPTRALQLTRSRYSARGIKRQSLKSPSITLCAWKN